MVKRLSFLSVAAFAMLIGTFAISSTFNIGDGSVSATANGATASLELDSVIDISAPSTVTLNCTPGSTDATSELCTSNATVTVNTNNTAGYTLQMNTTNGSSNSLTNTGITPNATIPTLSQAYSAANFPVNSWGYTGGTDKSSETGGYNCSTNYCPILAYNSDPTTYSPNHIINQTDAPSTASTTSITFAGKVNTTKPSGTYATSVTFTAVTNYVPHPITNSMSMTDIDANTCSDTPTETTYTVVDPRDNKSYAVAKLADGNCWMLDNLALDLVASKNNITSSNTNASDTYLNYLKGVNTGTTSDQYPTAGVAYWTSSYSYSAPLIAIKNANDDTWNPDTVASVTYGNGSGKIGVYYNYCAASAGSYCWGNGTSSTGSPESDPKSDTLYDIDADICPAGWHMPTTTSGSGEYYYLYNTAYSANQTNFKNALSTPLSGLFYDDSARNQGSFGGFWSSTWYGTSNMSYLLVYASTVYPSNTNNRVNGNSLRCLRSGS